MWRDVVCGRSAMPRNFQDDDVVTHRTTFLEAPPGESIPRRERDVPVSDGAGNGSRGGDFDDFGDWDDGSHGDEGRQREYWFTPRSAYRTGVFWAAASIASLFATLSTVLETKWVHSKHWSATPVPGILYWNTAVLLVSSCTTAFAQICSTRGRRRASRFALQSTFVLGCAFLGGQILAWRELHAQGIYLASNAGSLFFYVITAMHAVHLAGGIIALAYILLRANHLEGSGMEQAATESVAVYWHFMDGLWLYLLILLMFSGHRWG